MNETYNQHYIRILTLIEEKKEEIWLSPVTKTPTPTDQSKKQRDNIKTPPKTLITQLLRTDLGRYENNKKKDNRYENNKDNMCILFTKQVLKMTSSRFLSF